MRDDLFRDYLLFDTTDYSRGGRGVTDSRVVVLHITPVARRNHNHLLLCRLQLDAKRGLQIETDRVIQTRYGDV